MSDPTVRETAKQNDDKATAEMSEEKRLDAITECLTNFMFDEIERYVGPQNDFLEWIFDKFDNGDYAAAFYCIALRDWNLAGNITDTRKLATAFVDWIGD